MGTSPITIGVGNSAKALGKSITTAQRVTPPAQGQPPQARKAEFVVCDQTIKLAFKRLKSQLRLDGLHAKEPRLARACLLAKLILALLAERLVGWARHPFRFGLTHARRPPCGA
jgi:hypothetical protein